jgi:PAS domain-containing protein
VSAWNPAASALFGYSANEAIGRGIDELILRTDALRDEGLDVAREAATLGRAQRVGQRMRKDGSLVDVPHGQNARDLEFFVKYLGMTPMEAIRSATLYGGQIMMKGQELGALKEGHLADILLVDGDPLANLSILRDPKRLLAVMKDGVFAKQPEFASQRALGRAA